MARRQRRPAVRAANQIQELVERGLGQRLHAGHAVSGGGADRVFILPDAGAGQFVAIGRHAQPAFDHRGIGFHVELETIGIVAKAKGLLFAGFSACQLHGTRRQIVGAGMPLEHRCLCAEVTEHGINQAMRRGMQVIPANLMVAVSLHRRAQHMSQQLRTKADAKHRLALLQRGLDDPELGAQMRMPVLVLHIHRPTQHDEALVFLHVGLRVRCALEVVEADAMATRADARIQRAERLGSNVLKDHQARHASSIVARQRQQRGEGMRHIHMKCSTWFAALISACLPMLGAAAAPAVDKKFTIAVVPDTQYYLDFSKQRATGFAFDAVEIFYDQMQWLARNVESAGGEIAFVTQVGDVWQHVSEEMDPAHRALGLQAEAGGRASLADERTRTVEMPAARRGFAMLDGKVPFSVVPGNHDYDAAWQVKDVKPAVSHYGGLSNFNAVFGEQSTFFKGKKWRVGAFNGGADTATVFKAGSYRFLHLGLEFAPADDVVAWAESMLRKYPGMPTIVAIHDHLNKQGQRKPSPAADFTAAHPGHNSAEALWQKLLSRHAQIFLVVSGHQAGQSRRVDAGADGGKVWQLLADYQDRNQVLKQVVAPNTRAAGGVGDGWLRLLEFDFSGAIPRMHVRTYSTFFKAFSSELPNYSAWYKSTEHPEMSDADFLAEDDFTIELDDWVRRFGTGS